MSRACCPDFSCPSSTATTGTTGATGCPSGNAAQLCCLDILNTIEVQNQLRAQCITLSNQLNVSGSADIKGNAIVVGLTNFVEDVCMESNLTVGGNVTVAGEVGILGMLTVQQGALINGFTGPSTGGVTGLTGPAVQVIGNETVTGNVTLAGNQTITQDLSVGCAGTINGFLTASGALVVNNGSTIFNGGLLDVGDVYINNTLCINGTETVSGTVTVNGITVDGNATFNNFTVNPTGTLITNSSATFNDGLTIAAGNEIISAGNLFLNSGDISVAGTSTFESLISANGGVSIVGGLSVNGGQSNSLGNLVVTSGNGIFSGNLSVNGTITGGIGNLSSLTLTDTTNSLAPTSGTLVVTGGAGVAKDIWNAGSLYLANVAVTPAAPGVSGASSTGTPTALNYYEETCFASPFTWGGLTVNPPESILIRAVRLGNVVNLLIPPIYYNNPGTHIDVITSSQALPVRFRPVTTIRGASSTLIYSAISPSGVTGILGEYDVSPAGVITFGIPSAALGPQRIASNNFVEVDANTITYNIDGCVGSSSICFTGS